MKRRIVSIFIVGSSLLGAASACSSSVSGESGGASSSSASSSKASSSESSSSSSSASSGGGGAGGAECMVVSDCKPADACHVAAECDPSKKCVFDQAPDGTACDDGKYCTLGDACQKGACTAGTASPCGDATDCETFTCDEGTMTCTPNPMPDGTACDDGDPCTVSSACAGGQCVPGDVCPGTECNLGVCTPQGCETVPAAATTPCGYTDCSVGQCDGQGQCIITPQNVGSACDDGLFCTTGETCDADGHCSNGAPTCPDASPCVKGTCDEVAQECGAMVLPVGSSCDDGDVCTANDTCDNKTACVGTPPTVFFSDSFAGGNTKGWSLGPEWQIGVAKASSGQNQLNPDPGTDHSGDGFVAGVDIGGNEIVANPPNHPFYYLTSPVIDTSAAVGTLYLTFWRWLNSDYPPYMDDTIDVSTDGQNWTSIFSNTSGVFIADSSWTFESYDVSSYASATMQFRFGFDIGSPGVYTVSSWNIDDVKVQSAPCPK